MRVKQTDAQWEIFRRGAAARSANKCEKYAAERLRGALKTLTQGRHTKLPTLLSGELSPVRRSTYDISRRRRYIPTPARRAASARRANLIQAGDDEARQRMDP